MEPNDIIKEKFGEDFLNCIQDVKYQIFSSSILLNWFSYYIKNSNTSNTIAINTAQNFFDHLKNLILTEIILSLCRIVDTNNNASSIVYLQKCLEMHPFESQSDIDFVSETKKIVKELSDIVFPYKSIRNKAFAHLDRKRPKIIYPSYNDLIHMLEKAHSYPFRIYSKFADTHLSLEIPFKFEIGMAQLIGHLEDGARLRRFELRMIKERNWEALRVMGDDMSPRIRRFLSPP